MRAEGFRRGHGLGLPRAAPTCPELVLFVCVCCWSFVSVVVVSQTHLRYAAPVELKRLGRPQTHLTVFQAVPRRRVSDASGTKCRGFVSSVSDAPEMKRQARRPPKALAQAQFQMHYLAGALAAARSAAAAAAAAAVDATRRGATRLRMMGRKSVALKWVSKNR